MSTSENAPAALAATLQRRMGQIGSGAHDSDFGEITQDLSLKLNSYQSAIPLGDYQICRRAITDPPTLGRGSRVLVLWVDNEAVIIDALTNAKDVL